MSMDYQGITDHIVSAIREKDALLEGAKRENAALREAADAFLRAWEDDMGVETEQACAEKLALVLGGVTEPHAGRTEQRLSKSQLKRVSTQIDPLQFTWESPDGTSSPKCARCGHTWPEHEATASNLLCPDESAKGKSE